MDATLAAWGAIAALGWLLRMAWIARVGLALRWLRDLDPPEPARWPSLSVVLAARDERATIEATVEALLAQSYPGLEVVVVDDRSADGTGEILDRLAARDPRLCVVHVRELPAGWLGKVHALERGRAAARGEWLLFTDADVVFAPGTLCRALAHGLAERLDFLAASPEIRRTTFWADIAKGAFGVEFLLWMRPHRAGDPASGAFIGVGAFNLVRRAALERTPGFAWLRMEVADDIGLGLMLKRSGARCGFVVGIDAIATDWYAGLGDVLRGLEKNLFGGAVRYSYARLALLGALYAAFALGLALALSGAAGPWALGLALGAAALHAVLSVVGARLARAPVLEGLLLPVGTVFVGIALLRSAWRCWRHGGITWRGTFYPLAELRAGRRVALGP